jgi:Sigma-70 factor, region 1.1
MPETESELIYSLAYSDRHLGVVELDQLSRDIQAGAVFTLSKEQEDELRPAAHAYLEKGGYLSIAKADAQRKAAAERAERPNNTRRIEWRPSAPEVTRPALLDLTNASVRRLVITGKSRGWVTLDELNGVLPPSDLSAEDIESVMTALSDVGITVVESRQHVEEAKPKTDAGAQAESATVIGEKMPSEPQPTRSTSEIRIANRKPTGGERAQAGLAWFVVGGIAVALVTLIPAHIVGYREFKYEQFVHLCALVIGIGGAIYGRMPTFWK